MVPTGSSRTLRVFQPRAAIRKLPSRSQTPRTRRRPSRATTSMGKRIPQVWTPEEGTMKRPPPGSRPTLPSKPTSRDQAVDATRMLEPTTVFLLVLTIAICLPGCTVVCLQRLGRFLSAPNQDRQDHYAENSRNHANNGSSVHVVSFLLRLRHRLSIGPTY